jgi:hypothetical protein
MKKAPKLAVGDGALGFWKALPQAFGGTPTTLLDAQNWKRFRQTAEARSGSCERKPALKLDG